jgi:hypothetical protein
MANGVLCKRCGYQESDHIGGMFQQYRGDEKAMSADHPRLAKCIKKGGYIPKTKLGIKTQNDHYDEECNCLEGGW